MPNNAFFVMALEGLNIRENLGRGDKIASDLFITNDISIVDDNATPGFRGTIGDLEYEWLAKCGTIVYGHHRVEYNRQELHQPFIVYNIRKVQDFLHVLWLFHDNSVRFNLGFLEVREPNKTPLISSNNLTNYYTNAKGIMETLSLSRDDLRNARLTRRDLLAELPDFEAWLKQGFDNYQSYMLRAMKSKDYNRIERCFFFLNAARAEFLTPIKLTHYSICLECLFSTDQEELSHKVSERVAFFLESEGVNKRTAYEDVRMAYKVRSAIVHGDTLPKKVADPSSLAQKCDEYLRKALTKIISSPELHNLFDAGDSRVLADYLMSLYLPAGSS